MGQRTALGAGRLHIRFWITCSCAGQIGRADNSERPLFGARTHCVQPNIGAVDIDRKCLPDAACPRHLLLVGRIPDRAQSREQHDQSENLR